MLALSLLLVLPLGTLHAADASGLPASWKALGIRVGMPYAQARQALVGAGWQVEAPEAGGTPVFPATPEVECGQGRDAVCSAGYRKGTEAYGLMLETAKHGPLRVQGAY